MRQLNWAFAVALALLAGDYAYAQTQAQAVQPASKATIAWAAKPAKLPPYSGANRLVWRLADVLAAHKGKDTWNQEVFTSRDFTGEWISMAAGEKTKTQFYADDRVFWVVESGSDESQH
jgi:hypothetical protein